MLGRCDERLYLMAEAAVISEVSDELAKLIKEDIFCENCGAKCAEDDDFCPECGAKVVREASVTVQSDPFGIFTNGTQQSALPEIDFDKLNDGLDFLDEAKKKQAMEKKLQAFEYTADKSDETKYILLIIKLPLMTTIRSHYLRVILIKTKYFMINLNIYFL